MEDGTLVEERERERERRGQKAWKQRAMRAVSVVAERWWTEQEKRFSNRGPSME
jgi:hypothetical protein